MTTILIRIEIRALSEKNTSILVCPRFPWHVITQGEYRYAIIINNCLFCSNDENSFWVDTICIAKIPTEMILINMTLENLPIIFFLRKLVW